MATKAGQAAKSNAPRVTQGGKASGKRKLDFGGQRFRGKSFFLDLRGYRHAHDIETELIQRGATIEEKFHRGVKYLITSRPQDHRKSQSPSTPSPNTPGGTAKSNASQLLSPLTGSQGSVETRAKQTAAYQTRAQKVLQMSLQKQKSAAKVDIVARAKEWGCKVVYVDELMAELRKLKPVPQNSKKVTFTTKGRVQTLKQPFLKVEDMSRVYRPLVYEMTEWPRPDPHCLPKAGPFDSPKHAKTVTHSMRPPTQQKLDHAHQGQDHAHQGQGHTHQGQDQGQDHTHQPVQAVEKRPGLCECCAMRFDDLHLHLRSGKHRRYADNDANFANLDALIAQGTSFADFIAAVRGKAKASQRPAMRSPRKSPSKSLALSPQKPVRTSPRKLTGIAKVLLQDDVILVTPPGSQVSPEKPRSPVKVAKRKTNAVTSPSRSSGKHSPSCAAPKSPRTPRSLSRGKQTSPPSDCCSPAKLIGLPERVSQKAVSPFRQGELCLTRVTTNGNVPVTPRPEVWAPGPEHTPGFSTPLGLGPNDEAVPPVGQKRGWAIEKIARKLSRRQPIAGVKRQLASDGSSSSGTPPPKRVKREPQQLILESPNKRQTEVIPSPLPGIKMVADLVWNVAEEDLVVLETPEKEAQEVTRDLSRSTALCNLQSLIGKLRSPQQSPVNGAVFRTPERAQKRASLSPTQVTRRSPRLVEKERRVTQGSVTTRTELIQTFPPRNQTAFTVSYPLGAVALKTKTHAQSPAISNDLVSSAITPEIVLQGPLTRSDRESPLTGLGYGDASLSTSEGNAFRGFTPKSLQHAVPVFVEARTRVGGAEDDLKSSPVSSKECRSRRSPRLQKALDYGH